MFGYCSLQARSRPSCPLARWTWPRDAAAAASRSKAAKRDCQSGPSSAAMRRRTKGRPIGGAADWGWASSAAYSAGSAARMVGRLWAPLLSGRRVREGGQHLGHLHQRPFQAAERRPQLARVLAAVEVAPEQAGAGDAGRLAGDGTRDLGVAADPAAEPVLALEGRVGARRVAHAAPLREAGSASSSWSISRSTRPKPLLQKPGSPASRPKGASSSR